MKTILAAVCLLAGLSGAAVAQVDNYGRQLACTGSGPVTCSAGGVTITNGSLESVVAAFNGLAPPGYQAPAPALTSIPPLDFMARFTPAEQSAIATAAQGNAALMLFLLKMTAAAEVHPSDALTQAGVQAAVSAGLLTPARAAQVLDLSRASP